MAKRSQNKASQGGRKYAVRRHRDTGTAYEETVATQFEPDRGPYDRALQRPLLRGGEPAGDLPTLAESREHLRQALITLPWEGLALSQGDPAIPTAYLEAQR